MNNCIKIILLGIFSMGFFPISADDWAQFSKYEESNKNLKEREEKPKVVFMGNSITEGWELVHPEFFRDNNFISRGISGQTTYQMLLRFYDDVISLHPEVVVINGGTNDIAENNHQYNEERTFQNIKAMAEMAGKENIKVILTSVLPSIGFPWSESIEEVPEKIKSLNNRLENYARDNNLTYVDYYEGLNDGTGNIQTRFSYDGVHPLPEGYDVMEERILPEVIKCMNTEPIVIKLWEGQILKEQNGLSADDEEVSPGWISNVAVPELFIYLAPNPNGTAVLMCPGGGYGGVAIEHEGKGLRKLFNDNGITLCVLKYRIPNGHYSIPADDAREALRIMRENAEEWGIDKNRIGIGGASAGGHLASTVATHLQEDSNLNPNFQLLLYPVISMKDKITHEGSKILLLGDNPSQELVDSFCNEMQVTASTPPAFIAVSGDDDVVPVENSLLYFEALNNQGIPSELHIYPSGGHGWGYNPEFLYNDQWTSELINWIKNLNLK